MNIYPYGENGRCLFTKQQTITSFFRYIIISNFRVSRNFILHFHCQKNIFFKYSYGDEFCGVKCTENNFVKYDKWLSVEMLYHIQYLQTTHTHNSDTKLTLFWLGWRIRESFWVFSLSVWLFVCIITWMSLVLLNILTFLTAKTREFRCVCVCVYHFHLIPFACMYYIFKFK